MIPQGARVRATGIRGAKPQATHTVRSLGRAGLAARGVIYIVVGAIAVQIAVGKGAKEADRQGALETVAHTPGGTVLLWLLAIGLGGMAIWRFGEAVWGQAVPEGGKAARRLASLAGPVGFTLLNYPVPIRWLLL